LQMWHDTSLYPEMDNGITGTKQNVNQGLLLITRPAMLPQLWHWQTIPS
jgi:hypothetical protein